MNQIQEQAEIVVIDEAHHFSQPFPSNLLP